MDKLPNSVYPPIVLKSRIFTYFDVLNKNMTMKIHGNDIFKIKRTKKTKQSQNRTGLEFKILKTTKVQSSESNISIDKFYDLSFQQRCI